jgi:hypothetical protein
LHEFHFKKSFLQTFSSLQSPEQKRIQALTPAECLEVFQRNPTDLKKRFVTMDETWIYYNVPETKNQSKQWIGPGELAPKKTKTGKVIASVFWGSKGILLIDYLQKEKTINAQYDTRS